MKKFMFGFIFILLCSFVLADSAPQTGKPILSLENGDLVGLPQGDFDLDGDSIYHVYDFRNNGISDSVINMPFERSLRLLLRDYSTYLNKGTRNLFTRWLATDVYDGSGALLFDSNQDFATIPNTATTSFDNEGSYTWSFWLYTMDFLRVQKLVSKEVSGVSGYEIRIDENNRIKFVNPATWGSYTTSEMLTDGWNYIVVTYNQGIVNIYLNGIKQDLVLSGALNLVDDISSDTLLGVQGDEYFRGYFDEFKLYNKILSDDQILINYNRDVRRLSGNELRNGCYVCPITPVDDDGNGITRLSNEICF